VLHLACCGQGVKLYTRSEPRSTGSFTGVSRGAGKFCLIFFMHSFIVNHMIKVPLSTS